MTNQTINLALFCSGGGSNAKAIISYLQPNETIKPRLMVVNNAEAGALKHADQHQLPSHIITKKAELKNPALIAVLKDHDIDFIILAGFLWLIPIELIEAFPNRIINIHPALLPAYGGKGMFGHHIHEAIKAAGDTQTGLTIHLVDAHYDHGQHLFQHIIPLTGNETPQQIAATVLAQEHYHYPRVIEEYILKLGKM